MLSPRTRKAWLVAHVAVSVGWFGGAYVMLVLAVVGAHELMHLSDAAVMIPASLGALGTGLVLALGTRWRLLHHRWIVAKLVLTVAAMFYAALVVAQDVKASLKAASVSGVVIGGSAAMLLVLLVITAISVLKPWRRTRAGRRTRGAPARRDPAAPTPRSDRRGPARSSAGCR